VAKRLLDLGCDEISIADTIGHAVPAEVGRLLGLAIDAIPLDKLALHFHDTGGRALDNVDAALAHGVAIFDSAAGGMGGCPYAPGAPGNLGTEALVRHLEGRGVATGIDADAVARAVDALVRQAVTA
jgi:isopropylmalate/homocitrate/citramalate synthase